MKLSFGEIASRMLSNYFQALTPNNHFQIEPACGAGAKS